VQHTRSFACRLCRILPIFLLLLCGSDLRAEELQQKGEILARRLGNLEVYTLPDLNARTLVKGWPMDVHDAAYSPDGHWIAFVTSEQHLDKEWEQQRLWLLSRSDGAIRLLADLPDYYNATTQPRILWSSDGQQLTLEYLRTLRQPSSGIARDYAGPALATYDVSGQRLHSEEMSNAPRGNDTPEYSTSSRDGQWHADLTLRFPQSAYGMPEPFGHPTISVLLHKSGTAPVEVLLRVVEHGNVTYKIMPGIPPTLFVVECNRKIFRIDPGAPPKAAPIALLPELTIFLDYSPVPTSSSIQDLSLPASSSQAASQ